MSQSIRCLLLLSVSCTLLLGGCRLLPKTERGQTLEVEFAQVLPVGWEALGGWHGVNLDKDESEENLLFFRLDSGQVGALIYDAELAPTLDQSYRLLPRYFDDWGALGQGIIAPAGTEAKAIIHRQVDSTNDREESDENEEVITARELVILGGGTHLTFAWWESEVNGYGVTQIYAPGGFIGVDWEEWQRSPALIQAFTARYPLNDYRARSHICRMVLYTRVNDATRISFYEQSQGLHFCDGVVPPHPFSPEGVVLAYLLWQRPASAELAQLLTPGTTLPQLDADSVHDRWAIERIDDLAAYPSVPLALASSQNIQQDIQTPTVEIPTVGIQGNGVAPTTTVCVEFVEKTNLSMRRWVVFTLRYQPPDKAQQLPDRWTLSGARTEPAPMDSSASGTCSTILARRAP
jgi:hypothetical protein